MTVKSFRQYFQSLVLICVSFTLAALLFWSIILTVFSNPHASQASAQQAMVLKVAALLLAFICTTAARFVFAKRQVKLKARPLLADKLHGYKVSIFIVYILMDVPSVFAGMCYLLTGQKLLLLVPAVLFLLMLYFFPRKGRMMNELDFSQQQIDFIMQGTAKRAT